MPFAKLPAGGDSVAKKQLETMCIIAELCLQNSDKVQDGLVHLESFVDNSSERLDQEWPSEVKTMNSIPKGWLWQFVKSNNAKFTTQWLKKAEDHNKQIIRQITERATDVSPFSADAQGVQ